MEKIELKEQVELTNREKEVYRTLRTNLEFSGVENRVIAVSSCTPNDGKSTIAYYLASALAENGKRTLIVDADLRKSVFMVRFQVEGAKKGLSHYLSGQENLNEIIYATNKSNLFLIPTGVFPRNPTELLGNGRMDTALKILKNTFDYIIVDTPPIGTVIDAAVVAKVCDASMLVVASGESSKGQVRSVISQLKTANPNFLGVVLNKVDSKTGSYYGKRYERYYGKYYGKYYGNGYDSYY